MIPRLCESALAQLLKSFPAVALLGPRQAGKTTLAKHIEGSLSAVRMSANDWMTALSINLHAEEQRAKVEALQWELAKRLLSLRQNVVIEWGAWAKAERDAFRTAARAFARGR